jgi:GH35 family endo-1,4-beta-xylanase
VLSTLGKQTIKNCRSYTSCESEFGKAFRFPLRAFQCRWPCAGSLDDRVVETKIAYCVYGVSSLDSPMRRSHTPAYAEAHQSPQVRFFDFGIILVLIGMTCTCSRGTHSSAPAPPPVAKIATLRDASSMRNVIIGAAADPTHLGEAPYASTLATQFDQLEPENQMKFGPVHPRLGADVSAYDFAPADQLVTFAQQHKMLVRGHCFVWHQQVPDWLTTGVSNHTYDSAALSNILQNHISTIARHFADKVWAWDVVNEAFNDDGTLRDTIWYDAPGIGFAGRGTSYIEQAFRWAHTADPQAKLFYNGYDAETVNDKSNAIYAMAKDFQAGGVPLDGIGFQMHGHLSFNDPNTLNSFGCGYFRTTANRMCNERFRLR